MAEFLAEPPTPGLALPAQALLQWGEPLGQPHHVSIHYDNTLTVDPNQTTKHFRSFKIFANTKNYKNGALPRLTHAGTSLSHLKICFLRSQHLGHERLSLTNFLVRFFHLNISADEELQHKTSDHVDNWEANVASSRSQPSPWKLKLSFPSQIPRVTSRWQNQIRFFHVFPCFPSLCFVFCYWLLQSKHGHQPIDTPSICSYNLPHLQFHRHLLHLTAALVHPWQMHQISNSLVLQWIHVKMCTIFSCFKPCKCTCIPVKSWFCEQWSFKFVVPNRNAISFQTLLKSPSSLFLPLLFFHNQPNVACKLNSQSLFALYLNSM